MSNKVFDGRLLKCNACEKELPCTTENFYKSGGYKCKECCKLARKKNDAKNKAERGEFHPPGKKCSKCHRVCGDIETTEVPCASGGVRIIKEEIKIRVTRSNCKFCEKEYDIVVGKSDYRKEQKKKAYSDFMKKDPHYHAKWAAKQRENPNCFRVTSSNIRNETLKAKFDSENYNQTLCTTVNDFRNKIASRFTETMNWGNHNEVWTFDHVIPLKLCNIDDVNSPHFSANLKNAGGWWNVAPIALTKNMEKKTTVDVQQLKSHLDWLEQYKEHPDVKNYVEFAKGFV